MERKTGLLKFAAVLMLCSAPAYSSVTYSVESVAAASGSNGDTFDVLLTNTNSSSIFVEGFNFEIETSDTDITFTGVFTSTATAPYIFAGNSLLGPEIDLSTNPTVTALDAYAVPLGSVSVGAGSTVGLGQVFFNVSPTAVLAPATVSFTGTLGFNNLTDGSGDPIPIDAFTSGTITIGGSSVPEPSSILLTLAGAGALAGWARRKRRVA